LFALICITGPIAGIVTGGVLTTRYGGYTSINALKLLLGESIITPFVALPIAFLSSFNVTMVMIWFLLFMGGTTMPNLIGIMLSVVKDHEKTCALSIANFAYNAIGFLPAPFIYGLIYDSGDGGHARAAFF
jgi:MFS family permease